ncbi:MAG: hypothetical protein WCC53_07185 [Thermoanaerobaculia bacterium]
MIASTLLAAVLSASVLSQATTELVQMHGESQRPRVTRGVDQAASLWRASDGDGDAFVAFAKENFASDPKVLDGLLERFEENLESLDGHMHEIGRDLARRTVIETGPILPVDRLFGAWDPAAHAGEDLFAQKIAFVALLNFPLSTLEERLGKGGDWTRKQWAEARLASRFETRIPADVRQGLSQAEADAELYIAQYNVWMHHVVDAKGARLWTKGLKLLSHWNLRDEIKANYASKDGFAKQRAIAKVMDRIVTQTIPAAAVDNPAVDWDPFTNAVTPAPPSEVEAGGRPKSAGGEREPDTRYARLLACFKAARAVDPYTPVTPSLIRRRFEVDREIPEARVEALFTEILTSPLIPRIASVIQKRLGRRLEPFDVWYDGFRPRSQYPEAELDALTKARYPSAAAYKADMPRLFAGLGFTSEKARWLADRIVVDPARGSGHAMPAVRKGDVPHLRTRVEPGGMDYKGYNIAVHEMGHNVEQLFSLYEVDHWLLSRVPNTAFTEALAFVFQARDLELLGLPGPDAEAKRLKALNELWQTWEIAGPALVDMRVWHWMYDHPDATPAALKDATVAISRDVWNRYYAPVLGGRDATLPGIYSHMVGYFLYLPDYVLGHLIANQVEEHFEKSGRPLGEEFERVARFGSVTPDLWMKNATGGPLSARPMFRAAEAALEAEKK